MQPSAVNVASDETSLSELSLAYQEANNTFKQCHSIVEQPTRFHRNPPKTSMDDLLYRMKDQIRDMERLETLLKERGHREIYEVGAEAGSTIARFELENLRKKCEERFTKIFGSQSLTIDERELLSREEELPAPDQSHTSASEDMQICTTAPHAVALRQNTSSQHRIGKHQYTTGNLLHMPNPELYKIFLYILSSFRSTIRELNSLLDRKLLKKQSLTVIKGCLTSMQTITAIFQQRGVRIGYNNLYEDSQVKVEALQKRLLKQDFEEVFGPGDVFKQGPEHSLEQIRSVAQDMQTIPALSHPIYIYLREDTTEYPYYEPYSSLAADTAFARLAEWDNVYVGITVQAHYVKNNPCTMLGLTKVKAQFKDELKGFKKLNPEGTSLRNLNFSLPDIRESSFRLTQEEVKKKMHDNGLWRMYDANFGAFLMPTLRDLVEQFGFSVEFALERDWFIFFHRPVNSEEPIFSKEPFDKLEGPFYHRKEEMSEEAWKALLEEKKSQFRTLWKREPTIAEENALQSEIHVISAALKAKQREVATLSPEKADTYLQERYDQQQQMKKELSKTGLQRSVSEGHIYRRLEKSAPKKGLLDRFNKLIPR